MGFKTRSLPPEIANHQHGERDLQRDIDTILPRCFEEMAKFGEPTLLPNTATISYYFNELVPEPEPDFSDEMTKYMVSRVFWIKRIHAGVLDAIVGMP